MPKICAEMRSYSAMRGVAMIQSSFVRCAASYSRIFSFASNRRGREGTPLAFRDGDTARQMVLSDRDGSATRRSAFSGSRPRFTHSTEA